MVVLTITPSLSSDDWERLYAALRRGEHVVLRAPSGDHAAVRQALAERGVLDVLDGGPEGLEIQGIGMCA